MKLGFMCSQFMDLETKCNKNCFFLNANCFGSKWVSSYQTLTSRSVSKALFKHLRCSVSRKQLIIHWKTLTFFAKRSNLHVWQGTEYTFDLSLEKLMFFVVIVASLFFLFVSFYFVFTSMWSNPLTTQPFDRHNVKLLITYTII